MADIVFIESVAATVVEVAVNTALALTRTPRAPWLRVVRWVGLSCVPGAVGIGFAAYLASDWTGTLLIAALGLLGLAAASGALLSWREPAEVEATSARTE
ncbi:MAG: hypothetical protein MJE66_04885 [Proteobacteria bacterium]|nr:hypothetical protein [Pseudomonadota bacterium]